MSCYPDWREKCRIMMMIRRDSRPIPIRSLTQQLKFISWKFKALMLTQKTNLRVRRDEIRRNTFIISRDFAVLQLFSELGGKKENKLFERGSRDVFFLPLHAGKARHLSSVQIEDRKAVTDRWGTVCLNLQSLEMLSSLPMLKNTKECQTSSLRRWEEAKRIWREESGAMERRRIRHRGWQRD